MGLHTRGEIKIFRAAGGGRHQGKNFWSNNSQPVGPNPFGGQITLSQWLQIKFPA